ncbi:EI24 domain-containing protein [Parasphingorhabdus cellanae]|uniref:EI24 domain-containing protein n=1 Tax=Parasphingorhabdus cellanae TaxID=2806553 RepID=A0ABX7SYY0_9SPHN|nr:EI24 domain-containing protein [Parasphingorhabdus cellanae]QTD54484.1 EI24 domain-containing protein [Parasphingorhabdus cellanae]
MINALLLSLGQLSDRRILSLLLKVFLISLLLLAVFGVGAYFLLSWLLSFAAFDGGGFAAAAAAAIITVLTAIFLFRVIAIFVLNIFSDDIVDAVEAQHYPDRAAQAKPPGYALGLKMGLASVGRAIGYNILASPIYIMLLVTGVGAPIAFFAVNAILIGRDLQDMIAARHVDDVARIHDDWRLTKLTRFALGLTTALLLAIPFVNFLAPVLGAAMATHLVHQKRENGIEKSN